MSGTNLLFEDFTVGKVSGHVGGGEKVGVGVLPRFILKFALSVEISKFELNALRWFAHVFNFASLTLPFSLPPSL